MPLGTQCQLSSGKYFHLYLLATPALTNLSLLREGNNLSWLATITAKEKPQFGVSVLKSALAPLASPVSTNKPHVDTKKMCVTAVLTARSPDRQGDIVDPLGGNFGEHMANPVVMFHHGKQHRLPIGKAEDPDGNYTVQNYKAQQGDLLFGTTYFAQSNAFANDVFGLIAEDVLRGVSIGFDPLYHKDAVEELGESPILDRPALHFKSWKLLEYSHTPIGVHPEALTAIVRKAEDGSRKMHPTLVRVLQPYATPKRTTVAVTTTKGCEGMPTAQKAAVAAAKDKSKTKPKPSAVVNVAPEVTKAMPDDEDQDDTGVGQPEVGDGTDPGDDDPGSSDQYDPSRDDPNDDPNLPANATYQPEEDNTPPTVRALLDGSQGLTDLAASLEEAMKKGEHPGGRRFCAGMCDSLRALAKKMQAKAQGIHSELNGGLDASGDDGEGDDSEGAGDVAAEGDPEADDNAGDAADADEDAEEDASEPEEPPPTDDEGAVMTKGIDYSPRRFVFVNGHDAAPATVQDDQVPSAITAAVPRKLKALEEENDDLKKQNAEMSEMLEKLFDDIEAGKRRRGE